MTWTSFDSPLGELVAVVEDGALVRLGPPVDEPPAGPRDDDDPVLVLVRTQIGEYFAGTRTTFDLPLGPPGTAFQRRVWDQLSRIPYGTTTTYLELARRLGDVKAVRAVGMANGRNPIALVVPCHRVVGSDGALRGYAHGVERKRALLAHESATLC